MDAAELTNLAIDALSAPFTRLWKEGIQTYWVTYIGALALAGAYYLWSHRHKPSRPSRMLRYLFPRKILRHPSTLLDLKLYFFTSAYLVVQAAIILASVPALEPFFTRCLTLLGPATTTPTPWALALVLPFFYLLVIELAYWLAHWIMHRWPPMWEFHKTHHSAEVMTPLTEWRQHPIEYLFFPAMIGTFLAFALALVHWAFGPEPESFWSVTLLLFAFTLTTVHLRHTHLRMSAPRWLAHVIQTPAHHHIHHSTEQRHFDKNLGYCLCLWDWAFGTLYLPEHDQRITFGIDDPLTKNYCLRDHLLWPFARATHLLRTGKHRHTT